MLNSPPPLLTHARLRALVPDPPATVRVQNLSTTLHHVGHDAWNRPHKQQPCLLSAEVAFADPFDNASATDRLGEDTVHYGTLSKAVLSHVARWDERHADIADGLPLAMLPKALWGDLTGGCSFEVEDWEKGRVGVLDPSKARLLSITAALPKASLLGEGVSVTASGVLQSEGDKSRLEARASALEIQRLRVPTLIGVNENERAAKQFVVVTVTVEGFTRGKDVYTDIEAAVVKVSFACNLQPGWSRRASADASRRWRSRPSRPSRHSALTWQMLYWPRNGVKSTGKSASEWRSPLPYPWQTVPSWRSGSASSFSQEASSGTHARPEHFIGVSNSTLADCQCSDPAMRLISRTAGHRRL
jgi:dihydroneopterin aldolase